MFLAQQVYSELEGNINQEFRFALRASHPGIFFAGVEGIARSELQNLQDSGGIFLPDCQNFGPKLHESFSQQNGKV